MFRFATFVFTACLVLPMGAQTSAGSTDFNDVQVQARVQAALSDRAFDGSSIVSSVNGGVVHLTGNVRSQAEKELVSQNLANVAGVKTVLNDLNVSPTGTQSASASTAAAFTGTRILTLAAGTAIPVRLSTDINTKTAKIGDTFHGTTASNVDLNGYTAISAGTAVTGSVIDAKSGGRFSGAATLSIQLVSLQLAGANGTGGVALATDPISSQGTGKGGNTAARAGGGAILGSLVGAIAGGGTGAAVGAAGGGAAGAGSGGITKGKQIDLRPEQLLQFRMSAPLDVKIMLQDGKQVSTAPDSAVSLQSRSAQQ